MGRSLAPPELRDSRRHVVDLSSLSAELPTPRWEQSGVNLAAAAVQREWGQGAGGSSAAPSHQSVIAVNELRLCPSPNRVHVFQLHPRGDSPGMKPTT